MKTEHTLGPWKIEPDWEKRGLHPYHENRFITSGVYASNDEEFLDDPTCVVICSLRDCPNQEHYISDVEKETEETAKDAS